MRPEAVVFDIGNVLIEWQPERFYDAKIGIYQRRRMFHEVDLHGMNERVDLGGPFREIVYETADAYPDWDAEIRMWHDNWIDIAAPAIDHSVRLLDALRTKGIPVFALTNFGIETFDQAADHYPFLRNFDKLFVSGHMRVVKPDPQIYRQVEAECGYAAPKLLFADDRPENIVAAQARGWQTHLFTSAKEWARTLVRYKLLTEEEAA